MIHWGSYYGKITIDCFNYWRTNLNEVEIVMVHEFENNSKEFGKPISRYVYIHQVQLRKMG